MKKHLILLSVVLLGMFSFTSCDDDELERPDISKGTENISTELQKMAASVEILHRGQCDSVYVGTTKSVVYELYKLTSQDNPKAIKYTTSHGTDLYLIESKDLKFHQQGEYFISDRIPESAESVYVAAMYLKDNPTEWYPVILSVRESEDAETRAADENAETRAVDGNALLKRVATVLGHPVRTDTLGTAVNMGKQWLAVNNMKLDRYVHATQNNEVLKEEFTRNVTDGWSNTWSESVGINWMKAYNIFTRYINVNISETVKKQKTRDNEKEWKSYEISSNAMSGSLDPVTIFAYPHECCSEGLNLVLNGGGRTPYSKKLEGAFKIIDDYGAFLSSQGSFGAKASYKYERTAHKATSSIHIEAEVAASCTDYIDKDPLEGHATTGDALMAYINAKYGLGRKFSTSINFKFDKDESDYFSAIDAKITMRLYGGNCMTTTDYSQWVPTEDPNNWNLTSFKASGKACEKIIPLYYFISNLESPRGKQILYALTGDSIYHEEESDEMFLNDNCPYVKYLESKAEAVNYDESAMVIADAMLVKGGFNDGPKSFAATCHDGKKRLFHPLILNMNAGDMVNGGDGRHNMNGYGAQFGCDSNEYEGYFDSMVWADHSDNWRNQTITLYYAMDHINNCTGIESLYVGDNLITGYVKRGDSFLDFFNNSTSDRSQNNVSLYVKYYREEEKKDILNNNKWDFVTGIALVAGSQQNGVPQNWKVGYPIASSMYTEMQSAINEEKFNYFWNPIQAKGLYTIYPNYNLNKVYEICVGRETYPREYKAYCSLGDDVKYYYGPFTDHTLSFDCAGNMLNFSHLPAMFTNDNTKYGSGRNLCLFLNYTTLKLSPEHRTAVRMAKTWPYDVKK